MYYQENLNYLGLFSGSNYKINYKVFFNLGFDKSEMSQIIIIKK